MDIPPVPSPFAEPAPENRPVSRNLRAELEANLESAFTANIKAAVTLPDAVAESLIGLLSASTPTSSDVIAALSLEDTTESEVPSE